MIIHLKDAITYYGEWKSRLVPIIGNDEELDRLAREAASEFVKDGKDVYGRYSGAVNKEKLYDNLEGNWKLFCKMIANDRIGKRFDYEDLFSTIWEERENG